MGRSDVNVLQPEAALRPEGRERREADGVTDDPFLCLRNDALARRSGPEKRLMKLRRRACDRMRKPFVVG